MLAPAMLSTLPRLTDANTLILCAEKSAGLQRGVSRREVADTCLNVDRDEPRDDGRANDGPADIEALAADLVKKGLRRAPVSVRLPRIIACDYRIQSISYSLTAVTDEWYQIEMLAWCIAW